VGLGGSELSPLFLRLVLERLEWEPAMCGVMRAVCSTWGSILDSLLPRVVPRGSATVMKGKLGWYQSVVEVDLTRWRTTPGLLLGYFQTQVSVCELSLGGELHDEGLGSHGIHRGVGDFPCFRDLASAPKVRWQAGAQDPALEQEPQALACVTRPYTDHAGYSATQGTVTTQGTVPRRVQ
jgi:hypothetical protein